MVRRLVRLSVLHNNVTWVQRGALRRVGELCSGSFCVLSLRGIREGASKFSVGSY